MASRRTGLLLALGVVAAAAGFGTGTPPAQAAAVTHAVECDPTFANGLKFTWNPQIELAVAPLKPTYAVGDEVTVTWSWKTPPRNPSSWVLIAKDTAEPSGVVKLSGSQTGEVKVAGPKKNPTTGGGQPLPVEAMTGKFTVDREGRIDLTPGAYAIDTLLWGPPVPCTPTGTTPVSTSIQSGTPSTPGPQPTDDPGTPGGPGTTPPTTGQPGTPGATGTPGVTGAPGTPGGPTGSPGTTTPPAASGGPSTGSVGGQSPAPGDGSPSDAPAPGDAPPAAGGPPPPGPLFMKADQQAVVMGDLLPGSGPRQVTGQLHPLQVVDQRGSTLGWTLTGQIGDFVAPDGSLIPASGFAWTPNCLATGTTSSAVSNGLPGDAADSPELLCRQNPSMGEVTGGEFQVDAALTLGVTVPTTEAAPYTAELTLSLI
ncbi:hypothetical protein [Yinghuangia sp. YIM S09857]|uniref:hypothetical protein n=1 Tax=Yinghuangia sp. YIM S09857 TaxID=3436929 RepID=UPI003F53A79E